MASSVYVVDSSAKRTQVKVTPGKYMREVLEEACKSRKLNPEEFSLKTQSNKTLDLSQPFRLSGLSAGAKLQLTQASKSPGVVSVAIQLPDSEGGGRLSDKFPSSTSLWLVLRKYEDAVAGSSAKKLNLTQRGVPSNTSGSGRLMYEQPCLHVIGRNLETFTELQKTLAQLGLNGGSALIRLTFKPTETPLEDAMKEMSGYFNSVDTVPAGIGSSASQGPTAVNTSSNVIMAQASNETAENTAVPTQDETMREPNDNGQTTETTESRVVEDDATPTPSDTITQPSVPDNPPRSDTINGISVYRPPSSSTPAAALYNDDPTVFEPTIDHAKSHQAALAQAGKNKRLLSDKEIEEQEAAKQEKLATVQSVVVRVRYPDQSQIETTIYPSETAADLYAKVMETLAAAPEPFELRYTGSKAHEILPNSASQRLVRDFGFRGKVLVTLVWSSDASLKAREGPSLKEEYRRHAKDLKVELSTQQAEGESAHRTAMQKLDTAPASSAEGGQGKKEDLESKMKKFLGFGKKK